MTAPDRLRIRQTEDRANSRPRPEQIPNKADPIGASVQMRGCERGNMVAITDKRLVARPTGIWQVRCVIDIPTRSAIEQ